MASVHKTGYLVKEGKLKSWKRRYIVLQDGKVTYFKTHKEGEKAEGTLVLDSAAAVTALDGDAAKGKKHMFSLTGSGKTWHLIAETDEERAAWVEALTTATGGKPSEGKSKKRMTADDFTLVKLIGKGNFGKVMLVTLNASGETFAMKVLSKKHIVESNEIEHTMSECSILQRLSHPFLIKLHYAFQTEDKLYLILDFVNGGELFYHLQREKKFAEGRVRFYGAEILLGLEHLHNNSVLYRDLKLENLLLTSQGHVVMTDFGLSKDGLVGSEARTGTFCGTPEYMAPEMLSAKGYGKQVDWWSFGSLIYEMLTGLPPFYSQDIQEMYRRIVSDRLTFPPHVSENTRSLLSLLLEKDPSKRLTDPELIKRHPFFEGIDWDALYHRKVTPPFTPPVKSGGDISQIDPVFTQEAPSLDLGSEAAGSDEQVAKDTFAGFTYVKPTTS
jgi:RAC serine/threonine-protein kinase